MAKGILGKKIGMTQIFEADGRLIPVTVVEAGPCVVVQNKTEETDGYNAVQLGFGEVKEKHMTRPMKGHFDKAGELRLNLSKSCGCLLLLNIQSANKSLLTFLLLEN